MNKFFILIIAVSFFSCKKIVTEKHLNGTYQLVAVKKAFGENITNHPHLNALFSFNANNVLTYTLNGNTQNGMYKIISRPINYNAESGNAMQDEKGLSIKIANNFGNSIINWEIYNIRFANNRQEIKGYILENNKYYYLSFEKK